MMEMGVISASYLPNPNPLRVRPVMTPWLLKPPAVGECVVCIRAVVRRVLEAGILTSIDHFIFVGI